MARLSPFSIALASLAAFAAAGAYRAGSAPLPAGLQYDEIDRAVIGSATPPPPGSFDTDYAALQSSASQPKKTHGGMFGGIMNIEQNARDAMSSVTNGRITRYSYYNNWERTDDIAGKTATIRKCDLRQIIELDLDKRTYRIIDTTPKPGGGGAPPPPPAPHPPGAPPDNGAPGTATLDFSRVSKALGTVMISGLSTLHFTSTNSMSMTNATGSCKNGSFSVTQDQYISSYAQPHPMCPVDFQQPAAAPVPRDPSQMVARGGCKPTITTHVSGATEPPGKLALYSLMTMATASGGSAQPANAPPGGFSFLTERGNVRPLVGADAGLFDIPSDFTKQP